MKKNILLKVKLYTFLCLRAGDMMAALKQPAILRSDQSESTLLHIH